MVSRTKNYPENILETTTNLTKEKTEIFKKKTEHHFISKFFCFTKK